MQEGRSAVEAEQVVPSAYALDGESRERWWIGPEEEICGVSLSG